MIAAKLYKIVESKRPGFKYNLAMDAVIVDKILTKFIPFSWRAAMNENLFKLNKKKQSVPKQEFLNRGLGEATPFPSI
ncbi:MAG: hypothetical protein P4L41_08195 [Flavipsychrobacter sp.]|nr:hypothetical protein [Flavipsychrobacter sp.]